MIVKCPKCRAENTETARFCSQCATPLPSSPDDQSVFTATLEIPAEKLTRGTLFANRYEIIEELGAGGMGRVYRAEDTKVKEQIALKLIRPEIAADKKTIDRFRSELKTARRVRHKNVTGMYDLKEEKGIHYITMEYVPGEDLRSLIKRVGQLPVAKSVSIAEQICAGLSEAHDLGIVHRDLKPANIMIDRDGNARIMDFGIARSLEATSITEAGVMIGTPEYMSPEQAEGKDADPRSDIYSLGIILYVMLTSRLPFEAKTALDLLLKHKTERPQDPRDFNPLIPEALGRVILRCLEKDKDRRWADARGLLAALRAVREPEGVTSRPSIYKTSIAVLPFKNMSGHPGNEHFSDGLSESIINSLSQIRDFKVVARTSAFSFKGRDVDIREIGRRLDVDHVLEGSVQRAGNRLRITAQLIKVKDGFHLWSEQFDRTLDDIFSIQDEISLQILDSLRIRLQKREKDLVLKRYTEDVQAYTLFLKGRYHWNKMSKEGIDKALEYFHQVIHHDPLYAPAYAGIADGHALCSWYHYYPPSQALSIAKTYAEKALEIDDGISEAHSALGFVKMLYERDWKSAGREFKRAEELNPGNTNNLFYYSVYFSALGRHEESVAVAKRALEIDPVSVLLMINLAMRFFYKRQFDTALKQAEKAVELDPSSFVGHFYSSFVYLYQGMYRKALEKIELARRLLQGQSPPHYQCYLALIHAFSGETEKAENILKELTETQDPESPAISLVPWVHIALGRTDEAFEQLENGFQAHNPMMIWIKSDPIFDRVKEDSRYTSLLEKVGLATDAGRASREIAKAPSPWVSIPSGAPAAVKPKKSIIVLPFANISPDPEQDYFCDGMTEEIITDLSHIHDLLVISRSSAMTFKGTKKAIPEIARAVNVRFILEGSVRKAGKSLRITAQLIDAANDAHLWAEKYTGTLDDVFDIQEKVSRSIADALKVRLTPEEKHGLEEHPVQDARAYECYLKAQQEIWRWTEDGFDRAVQYLNNGLDIVGDNALLRAGLGYVYWNYVNLGFKGDDFLDRAETSVKAALDLNPASQKSQFVLGLIHNLRGNQVKCIRQLEKSLALDPNDTDVLFWLVCAYSMLAGKSQACAQLVERLVRHDPLNPNSYMAQGMPHFFDGRFDLALNPFSTAYRMETSSPPFRFMCAQTLLLNNRREEAFALIDEGEKTSRDHPFTQTGILLKAAIQGDRPRLESMSPEFIRMAERDPYFPTLLAEDHAILGDKDKALRWLEQAAQRGNFNYPFFQNHDPFYENIRGEPRFKTLMERAKREWENFEA